MKVLLSTGNAEKDAKLLEEAFGRSNEVSRADAEKNEKAINADIGGEDNSGNALTDTPRVAGQVLAIIPDGAIESGEAKVPSGAATLEDEKAEKPFDTFAPKKADPFESDVNV